MTSFLTFLATPAIKQASEKSLFGSPYVRVGRLFTIVGNWVYQQGGVLGYVLRDHPDLLVKLMAPPEPSSFIPQQAIEELYGTRKLMAKEIENIANENMTFTSLYTKRELRDMGIELTKLPPDKGLNKKVDFNFANKVMRIAFVKGVAFGFHFPEKFSACWNESYSMVPEKEWTEAHNLGIVSSETQTTMTLGQATHAICEGALTWNTACSSGMLNDSDIRLLQTVIAEQEDLPAEQTIERTGGMSNTPKPGPDVKAIPTIGKDVQLTPMVGQVFRVLQFDRAGTTIDGKGKVKPKSLFKPYGYLLVESPIINMPMRMPILHKDDFGLAASVFDEPKLLEEMQEQEAELLVTYVPKKKLPGGLAGTSHALHYAIAPPGTLTRYYAFDNARHMANPAPEKIFGPLVWEGEIRVQANADPQL